MEEEVKKVVREEKEKKREKESEELLKQAMEDGFITCPRCGNHLDADAYKCNCGWRTFC